MNAKSDAMKNKIQENEKSIRKKKFNQTEIELLSYGYNERLRIEVWWWF